MKGRLSSWPTVNPKNSNSYVACSGLKYSSIILVINIRIKNKPRLKPLYFTLLNVNNKIKVISLYEIDSFNWTGCL